MNDEQIIWLDAVASTNAYLQENYNKYRSGTVVAAVEQQSGKGMGSNRWDSEKGMNLTFSYLLKQGSITATSHFMINIYTSVFFCDLLSKISGKKMEIKWPNDILLSEKKIAGILISNILMGHDILASIIGIGLNVNQEQFSAHYARDPISLKMVTGEIYDLKALLREITGALHKGYDVMQEGKNPMRMRREYEQRLYQYNQSKEYIIKGYRTVASITGVSDEGFLTLRDSKGNNHQCDLKDIVYC